MVNPELIVLVLYKYGLLKCERRHSVCVCVGIARKLCKGLVSLGLDTAAYKFRSIVHEVGKVA